MPSPVSLSPVEAFLPGGSARRAVVLGSACPPTLLPRAGPGEGDEPLDLAVLAPTAGEIGDAAWMAEALATCGDRLGRDGVFYGLVPPGAWRSVRHGLEARGFEVLAPVLHLPDAAESRLLVALERALARHAFTHVNPLSRTKRAVAGALVSIRAWRALARGRHVGMLARKPGGRPLLEWLPRHGVPPGGRRSAIVGRSPRADGSRLVVHPFTDGVAEPVVAKMVPPGPPGAEPERSRLERIGSVASAAGAVVPTAVDSVTLDGAEFTLETRVEGEIVAALLARDPSRLQAEVMRVCDWLGEWSRLSAGPERLGSDRLEREVLAPARSLAPLLKDGAAYVDALADRCDAVTGVEAPVTAAHNDLSMWNVLRRGEVIAIIDWESAEDAVLPFTDFFYAVADAIWAAGAHAERRDAVRAGFASDGAHSGWVGALRARLGAAIEAPEALLELSFHACWLRHGAYEARKHPGAATTPFLDIVRWAAEQLTDRP